MTHARRPRRAVVTLDALEPRRHFTASDPGIYPFAPGAPLRVTDADGTVAVFALGKSGLGQLTIADDGAWRLDLSGTTAKSTLTIAAAGGGDARVTLASVSSAAPVAAFTAPQTIVAGPVTLAATTLTLAGANGATIALSASTEAAPSLSLGQVTDSALTSASSLKALTVRSWIETGPDTHDDTITAPGIATLDVAGDFAPDVSLTVRKGTALGSAKVGGVTSGTWSVPAGVGALSLVHLTGTINVAGGAKSTTLADAVSLLPAPGATGGSIHVGGAGTVSASGDRFQVKNTTLYAAGSPDLYTYDDLHHLTHAGESAAYRLGGKRVTQTILPAAGDTYVLRSSPSFSQTYVLGDDGSASLVSLTELLGGATVTITFDAPLQLSPARFARGQAYSYSADATIDVSDPKSGTIHASGPVTYTTTFQGHQLVKTPAGTFVAARFQDGLSFNGRGTISLNGFSADVMVAVTTMGPECASPATGVVTSAATTTLTLTAPQLQEKQVRRATASEQLLALPKTDA